jgi:prepilin-type processing-associated H-X9-DG protein
VAILVTCQCGQQFQTSDQNAGRRARCPECGRELIIPKPAAAPDEPDFVGLEPVAKAFPPGETATSGKAIASLLLGLSSFLCMFVTGIPAIILGSSAQGDIRRSGGRITGGGMATAGIVLGAVGCSLMTFSVLIALLLPAVQAAREAARRAQCVNNMKQIGLAMHNFHSQRNTFPPAAITDRQGRPLLSWRVAILPYIEQDSLYQQFHLDEPWDSPHNLTLLRQMPQTYACPSQPNLAGTGNTTYQVVVGPNTMFTGNPKGVRLQDVTDGTSNTILVGEASRPVPWTAPQDIDMAAGAPMFGLGSKHPGGFNVLFADGSVRFIKTSIAGIVLHNLLTRAGGEVISTSSF